MKRAFCLLLAALLCLSLVPAVRADVLYEPEDSFFWEHRGECQYHSRTYYANGPDTVTEVYANPRSAAVTARVPKGDQLWISYVYEDENGILWGFCENFLEEWTGWVPMDYLLLKYDNTCFEEEFADRITDKPGELSTDGEIYFWAYPGSEDCTTFQADAEYLPQYERIFTDDAGREWAFVPYYMGARSSWICLDAPTADYPTLYAELQPQQVTHPTAPDTVPAEIKPGGPSLSAILAAAGILAVLSMGFLLFTRKKK